MENLCNPENLRRVNFGSLLAALALFFFPWIDVTCSGQRLISQNGIQMMVGAGSVPPAMTALIEKETQKSDSPEDNGFGPLVILGFLALLLTLALSIERFRPSGMDTTNPAGICACVAFCCIALQSCIGFPVESVIAEQFSRQMDKEKLPSSLQIPKGLPKDPFAAYSAQMDAQMKEANDGLNAAMAMSVQVERRGWFFLELFALAIPAGLFVRTCLNRKTLAGATPRRTNLFDQYGYNRKA